MKHKCDGCKYKGEHQEMMFKPFGVCHKFHNLWEAEKAYKADKCPFKNTNYDRIKAMSVEEMAEFIVSGTDYGSFYVGGNWCKKTSVIKWLESEVQGE